MKFTPPYRGTKLYEPLVPKCNSWVLLALLCLSFISSQAQHRLTQEDAQYRLARINDADGYTHLRSGKGKQFEIVGKLDTNDLFMAKDADSAWQYIGTNKWQSGEHIDGFIHKSRIEFIDTLPVNIQRKIIERVLLYLRKYRSTPNLALKDVSFIDTKYDRILELIPGYIAKTRDTAILSMLVNNIINDSGSADENNSYTLGDCFDKFPGLMSYIVKEIKRKSDKVSICNHIDWGLDNVFWNDWISGKKTKYLTAKRNLKRLVAEERLNLSIRMKPEE